jgi:cytochrome c oxidase cbb3-type subunit 3
MSNPWSWYVILGTTVSLAACFWLVAYANKQRASKEEIAESEAHVWDENIRELNNPLPMWWLWLFILTIVWSIFYLVYYPGMGDYEGMGGWSQEQQYADEVAAADAEYGPMFAAFGAMEVTELVNDPAALGIGASLFQNYCSQCHGSGAQGARGFPNLTDDDWLYGGSPAQIEQSIVAGRAGVMPPLGAVFATDDALDEMVRYVQAMPDGMDTASPAHTQYMTLCIACHGPTGAGMQALGAPSLVDDNWLYGSSPAEIRKSIVDGRIGEMPANGALIGADRARILAAYVYDLSRGSD